VKRIGLCGGTFDPFHQGHLALIEAALASGQIDQLIVMPAGQPPHKQKEKVSPAGYRFEMVVRAVEHLPHVTVSDLEIQRSGRSFTIDTIHQLQASLAADSQLVLVYGADILFDIEGWYHPADIMAECPLLLALRGGYDRQRVSAKAEDLAMRYSAHISFFPAPEIELSSTQIRQALRTGQPVGQAVPEPVQHFIEKHAFYRYDDELASIDPQIWATLADLERTLRPLLNAKRLLHSLNVTLYAIHLALRHNLPVEQAAVAGLLHDCAKCLSAHEVMHYAELAGDHQLLAPALAHGPAGAWLARERFGITDAAILRAIHYHTTGCATMTRLDQLIYIADKVEPARTYHHLEAIRAAAETDLDQAMLICLTEVEKFLIREQKPSHPYAQAALRSLQTGN
jgi:nicotinate-nucleotide adenylyltransferase